VVPWPLFVIEFQFFDPWMWSSDVHTPFMAQLREGLGIE
jgi:hypothetical protein